MRNIIFIIPVLILISCSVKKRTYCDGYYVDWAFKKQNSTPIKKSPAETTPVMPVEPVEVVTVKAQSDLDATVFRDKHAWPADTCGDVITFKSGDQVTVRVTEITDDKIKYKRCDNLEGPMFVVNKSTVASVKYANGVVEKIEAPSEPAYTPSTNSRPASYTHQEQRIHPLALGSLVSLIVGSFIAGLGVVIALVMSVIAISEINKNPKKWRGLILAKTVKTISIILLAVLALVLILLFA